MLHTIRLTADEMKSDENYIKVALSHFDTPVFSNDKVRILVDNEYEVFANVSFWDKTHVTLYIDTWSYSAIFDDDEPKSDLEIFNELSKLAEHLVFQDNQFHINLSDARTLKGLSRETVAERIGVSVDTVKKFESYWYDPKLSELRRYALAIGVSYHHILSDPKKDLL